MESNKIICLYTIMYFNRHMYNLYLNMRIAFIEYQTLTLFMVKFHAHDGSVANIK